MRERGGQLKHTMTQDLWFRNSSPSGLMCPARETLRALEAPRPSVAQSRPWWTVPRQPLCRAWWQALPPVLEVLFWLWAPQDSGTASS